MTTVIDKLKALRESSDYIDNHAVDVADMAGFIRYVGKVSDSSEIVLQKLLDEVNSTIDYLNSGCCGSIGVMHADNLAKLADRVGGVQQ